MLHASVIEDSITAHVYGWDNITAKSVQLSTHHVFLSTNMLDGDLPEPDPQDICSAAPVW